MKKSIRGIALALTMVILSSVTAQADPGTGQLQNQLQKDKNTLKNVQDQREDLDQKMEMLDQQIEDAMRQMDSNKKQMAQTQQNIKSTEAEIKKTDEDVKQQKVLFDKRIRSLYMDGNIGYLEIILDSQGIGDLISRAEAIGKIIVFDKKVVSDLKDKQDKLRLKQEDLHNQNTKLLTLQSDNENKLQNLKTAKDDQSKTIAQIKAQEKLYSARVDISQAQLNATMSQISDIRKNAPRIGYSRGGAPLSSNSVIAFATNYLGTPYVWGGSSPNPGFDCSGFTQFVYRHFGVSINRTTYDQINDGSKVSRGDLQPGDLVFFGSWGNPHHVGIYVGNGSYIHAPKTGDVIKISSIDNRRDFVTGVRVR